MCEIDVRAAADDGQQWRCLNYESVHSHHLLLLRYSRCKSARTYFVLVSLCCERSSLPFVLCRPFAFVNSFIIPTDIFRSRISCLPFTTSHTYTHEFINPGKWPRMEYRKCCVAITSAFLHFYLSHLHLMINCANCGFQLSMCPPLNEIQWAIYFRSHSNPVESFFSFFGSLTSGENKSKSHWRN